MKDIKIIIACHKKGIYPQDKLYLPLFVGANNKEDIGILRDDTGKNISHKNDKYCELTGLYWAINNLDFAYLGLVHYRRYFSLNKEKDLNKILSYDEINDLLDKYDIILPKKRHYYIETIYSHYAHTFDHKHLDIVREIIKEEEKEYLKDFDDYMQKKSGYIFNMFIMPKEIINRYTDWLFPILEKLESRIDITNYNAFEKRYIGRIAERLFNIWLNHEIRINNIDKNKIKEINYIELGNIKMTKRIINFLKAKYFKTKYKESL